MSWTPPTTRATGDLITASIWNSDIVNNLKAITGWGVTGQPYGDGTYGNPGINGAYLVKVWLPATAVTSFNIRIGTSSGNIDVGIYTDSGGTPNTRLWSRGSLASPGVGQQQILISAGSPATLTPAGGPGWLAAASDNNTVTFARMNNSVFGMSKAATTVFPLPATISTSANNDSLVGAVLL